MKGIIFAGDSFTWGQGLHYYSELPNINSENFQFDINLLTEAHLQYIKRNRFPRLVADQFDTFEVVRKLNGGGSYDIIEFLENFETYRDSDNLNTKSFSYSDIDYVVFQFTETYRGQLCFLDDEGKYGWISADQNGNGVHPPHFLNYLEKYYNSNPKLFLEDYPNILCKKVETLLKNIEEKGIKTMVISWRKDIKEALYNNPFLKERLLSFKLHNTEVDTLEDFEHVRDDNSSGYTIHTDLSLINKFGKMIGDGHVSKRGIKIIADSVIKKIEEYEQPTIHPIQRRII
jgi:hypothetical protein